MLKMDVLDEILPLQVGGNDDLLSEDPFFSSFDLATFLPMTTSASVDRTSSFSQTDGYPLTPESTATGDTMSDSRHEVCAEKPVRIRTAVDSETEEKKCRQALAARVNRRKKKCELQNLEAKVTELTEANCTLREQVSPLSKQVETLEEEVLYLKSVLKNQSCLAKLLQNIPVSNVQLSSRFSEKRASPSSAAGDAPAAKRKYSGGLCLHVDQENVSVEFCRDCSRQAAQ